MRLREIGRRHLVEILEVADVADLLCAVQEAQAVEQGSVVRCFRRGEVLDRGEGVTPPTLHREDQRNRAIEAAVERHTRAVLDERLQILVWQDVLSNLARRALQSQRCACDDAELSLAREHGFEEVALLTSGTRDDIAGAGDDLQCERLVDLCAVAERCDSDATDR